MKTKYGGFEEQLWRISETRMKAEDQIYGIWGSNIYKSKSNSNYCSKI